MVLTEARDSRLPSAAVDAGALGLIEMSAPSEELLRATRDLMHGEVHLPSGGAVELVLRGRGEGDDLTGRDEDLVTEVAKGFTKAEIAEHMHLSVRTVEANRSRIHQKLGASSRAELVREALDRQLVH